MRRRPVPTVRPILEAALLSFEGLEDQGQGRAGMFFFFDVKSLAEPFSNERIGRAAVAFPGDGRRPGGGRESSPLFRLWASPLNTQVPRSPGRTTRPPSGASSW